MSLEYTRRVSPKLTVRFDHCDWDVSTVPGVRPGDMLLIATTFHGKRHTVYAKKYDEAKGRWVRFLIRPAGANVGAPLVGARQGEKRRARP